MISANPLDPAIAAKAVDASPYNRDYFLREFQKRAGRTPRDHMNKVCQSRHGRLMQLDEAEQAEALHRSGVQTPPVAGGV